MGLQEKKVRRQAGGQMRENVAHVEMGMNEEERQKYWAGHLTIAPTGPENVVGLKAILLEERVEPDTGELWKNLATIINDWARENWKTYNVVRLDYLPGTPRAVMLYVARIQDPEIREELWARGEAVQAFVAQYLAKQAELTQKALELRAVEDKARREKEEATHKETKRLAELGRSHEANCGKTKKAKKP